MWTDSAEIVLELSSRSSEKQRIVGYREETGAVSGIILIGHRAKLFEI